MKYFIANWKSNKNLQETMEWLNSWKNLSLSKDQAIVICPAFPFLPLFAQYLSDHKKNQHFYLGVQDVSPFPAGSYTGAVSTHNLAGLNINTL